MSRSVLIVCLALLSLAVPDHAVAADSDRLAGGRNVEDAYDTVKTAGRFTIGGVGYAGIPSRQEVAFRQVLKQPKPVARCQKLLVEAAPAGQLYGLLGLRLLDRRSFQAALPRYKSSRREVETMSGCIVRRTTAGEIAWKIEKGEIK